MDGRRRAGADDIAAAPVVPVRDVRGDVTAPGPGRHGRVQQRRPGHVADRESRGPPRPVDHDAVGGRATRGRRCSPAGSSSATSPTTRRPRTRRTPSGRTRRPARAECLERRTRRPGTDRHLVCHLGDGGVAQVGDCDHLGAARTTSSRFEGSLSATCERVATHTTGVDSSSSAIGPCFISPAA